MRFFNIIATDVLRSLFYQTPLLSPKLRYLIPHCFLSYPSCWTRYFKGKHLADISMAIYNREAGEGIPEIRNKGGGRKESAQDKRRE